MRSLGFWSVVLTETTGGVRDFLYFYWFDFPVFNVADSCLVVGAALLLIQAFFGGKPKTDPPAVPGEAAPQPTV